MQRRPAEEMLASPRVACLLDWVTRLDGEFRHHSQPFFLLTSSELEPIYSSGTHVQQ